MALRLTGTTLTQPSSATAPAVSPESLAQQAQMHLRRDGDVEAYAALFGQAATLEDPQRRFLAELTLLDAGLRATRDASEGVAIRTFVAVADAALTMLERDPREPLILNLAGVACYELWSLDVAQDLFRAARRLDPAHAEAGRNLGEVARRRRAGRRTRPMHAAVPGLSRRGRTVAAHARPATGLTLSLCMIVRDEEQMLPRCLAAAAPAVDEIIVVDTGSTDATVEIARSFGARVIEHPWTGSFSEARNTSFDAATGDWLIYLDADEVLVEDDIAPLRALTGQTWREAFYLVETSYLGELGDGGAMTNNALRVFRNRPQYRFRDRLHEQIWHTLPSDVPGRIEQTAVRVTHYGYLGAVRAAKEKSERNVELLRRQATEQAPTPFLHFNLGSEYVAAGDAPAAAAELRQARALLEAEGSLADCHYGAVLMSRLVLALRLSGRPAEARQVADEALALFPDLTDLVLAKARIAAALGDAGAAIALYRRCIEMGDAPARYGGSVGAGTYLPRMALAELHLAHGEAGAAREALAWCVENHPEFLAVAGLYTTALLRDGATTDEVAQALGRLGTLPLTVRASVAEALLQAGANVAAEEQLRLALDASAGGARVRTLLGEVLLARGAWDEAVECVRPVPDDDPHAGLAARIELMGLVGRADVADALRRAARAGVPRAELDVFDAWAAIADGEPAGDGLPVAGVPLLGVVLDTLLAGGDIPRFNALVPLLAGSRLPEREQRELLAGIYLDRGLTGPAAQQWMAVCNDQPDARALLGLARIAAAQGMTQDAATFATGALELDPACDSARRLLAPAA